MTALHLFTMTLPVLVPGLVLIVSLKRSWFARARRPLDGGAAWHGAPVMGQNKTWLGVALYVVGGAVVAGGLSLMGEYSAPVFDGPRSLVVGASVGAAYSVGEVLNSLVKRRAGVAPGQVTTGPWRRVQLATDLADGIVCASLVYLLWGVTWQGALGVCVLGLAIHLATDALMRRLSLKRHQQHGRGNRNGEVVEAPGAQPLDRR